MKLTIKMKFGFFLLILLLPLIAFAQSGTQREPGNIPEILDLDDCIEIALEKNYGLLIRKETVVRNAATRLNAWSRLMPSASMRYSWSHSGDDRYNFTETGFTVSNNHYSMGFSASQPLFAGGNNILSLKSSILNYRASEVEYTGEQKKLIYDVKQAYYTAVSAEQTLRNVEQSLERAREQWRFVAQRDTLGLADPTEVSQMKVTLAETELSLLQAQNGRRQAMERLFALLSLPMDRDIKLIEPNLASIETPSLDDLLEESIEQNPQIKAAELAKYSAQLTRFSSWSGYLPSVNASYSYNWSDNSMPDGFSEIWDDATWSFGVSASWSLFSGTSRIAGVRSANSGERSAELTLLQAKQTIETAVRLAYRNMEEASARIRLADARVEDAELNATLFREKFELGNSTILELLQAELSLQNALAENVKAVYDFRMAIAELERLSGIEMDI